MSDDPLAFLAEPSPAFFAQAACRGLDPGLFVLEQGESAAQAKAVCAGCGVRAECLEYALALPGKRCVGIWAGTAWRDRRRMRAQRDGTESTRPIAHGTDRGAQQHWYRGEKACDECRDAHNLYKQTRKAS